MERMTRVLHKYGERGRAPGAKFFELWKPLSIDERRKMMTSCVAVNQERRAQGFELITLEEYVAGRRK